MVQRIKSRLVRTKADMGEALHDDLLGMSFLRMARVTVYDLTNDYEIAFALPNVPRDGVYIRVAITGPRSWFGFLRRGVERELLERIGAWVGPIGLRRSDIVVSVVRP